MGVGRNLDDNGISQDEAMYLLANDVRRVRKQATIAEIIEDFALAMKYLSQCSADKLTLRKWAEKDVLTP